MVAHPYHLSGAIIPQQKLVVQFENNVSDLSNLHMGISANNLIVFSNLN